jgi:hypothetical protein
VKDVLKESHHGRAVGIVIWESDLEAKDGIGIWAWQVLEALAKSWLVCECRHRRYLCARTALPSRAKALQALALRTDPWDWRASDWRCNRKLVSVSVVGTGEGPDCLGAHHRSCRIKVEKHIQV